MPTRAGELFLMAWHRECAADAHASTRWASLIEGERLGVAGECARARSFLIEHLASIMERESCSTLQGIEQDPRFGRPISIDLSTEAKSFHPKRSCSRGRGTCCVRTDRAQSQLIPRQWSCRFGGGSHTSNGQARRVLALFRPRARAANVHS
jgi:hypothetical protein